MVRKSLLIVALVLGATIYSCKKKENIIPASRENIQGNWKHEYSIEPDITVPPEFEIIKFKNDSFYMRYRWASEFLTVKCPAGHGKNYVKGTYEIKERKIYFKGVFTKVDYVVNLDSSGCLSVGNWTDSFKISLQNDNVINLYWLIPISSMPEHHRIIKLNKI